MIKPLTSLRFLFAFMVFMSHCILFDNESNPFLHHIFFEGYVGVGFFFVLSGFILAYNYQQRFTDKHVSYKKFYVSRFARIYPLHIFTMLIWIWMNKNIDMDCTYFVNLIANIFLVQSFYPMEGFKFNAVSWSLSDEMFFYLLFPILVVWFVKSYKSFVFFIAGIFLLMLILIPVYEGTDRELWIFYYHPVMRLIDFSLGIILYNICQKEIVKNWVGSIKPNLLEAFAVITLVVFYCLACFIPEVYRHAVWYWLPICLLIAVFYFQRGAVSAFLSKKWCVYLGEISFSFYMFHTIVLWYVRRAFFIFFAETPSQYVVFVTGLFVAIAVSVLSYKFIEVPSNKCIKRALL